MKPFTLTLDTLEELQVYSTLLMQGRRSLSAAQAQAEDCAPHLTPIIVKADAFLARVSAAAQEAMAAEEAPAVEPNRKARRAAAATGGKGR